MRHSSLAILVSLLALSAVSAPVGQGASSAPALDDKPMSFHNRLLLNRLAVSGHTRVEIMLALREGSTEDALARVMRLGGQMRRSEPDVDYVRVEVPIDRVVELVADATVEAYQIASLASAGWYPSAHSQSRAEIERRGEGLPVARVRAERQATLPPLTPEEARGSGYTADDDAGVGRWYREHPTFDGRGVTIAFLETALVEFGHPVLQVARTLDGAEIPKIVGVFNTLGPDEPDATLVDLDKHIQTTQTWHRVGNRTYTLPGPGSYAFGIFSLPVASNLIQPFAVIRNEATGEVRVDTDSDTDFRDESALVDVNTRMDVKQLRITHPRAVDLAFVFAAGRRPNQVHLYTAARHGHPTMAVSVATGHATEHGLASGVAPGARALVVRFTAIQPRFHTLIEGYLDTARRSDVDILCDSTGMWPVPDTAQEFASLFFRRLIARYGKPIFHAAGNGLRYVNNVSGVGDVFSVGGSIGPATFASLYGGPLRQPVVHRHSASGPSIDGAIKPDFLAPENRINAGVWIEDGYVAIPKNAPERYLPAGYEISCCTSSASPYAAGLAALLLSAAKQTGTAYSVESLGRALRVGAQFLPEWASYHQGNGVLEVNAAWRELTRSIDVPRITVTANVVHPLFPYAAPGTTAAGLFEQHGWTTGARGKRTFRFTRESGPRAATRYPLSWTGNDGTFSAPASIKLPLGAPTALEVNIDVSAPGAHSAILNVHDPATNAIVFRTQATIVAAESFDRKTGEVRLTGSIPMMGGREHFVQVPNGVTAMSVELEVVRGTVGATILTPDGLFHSYFDHVRPLGGQTFPRGRYTFLQPSPAAGIWSVNLENTSALHEADLTLVSTEDAEYLITIRILGASIAPQPAGASGVDAAITNHLGRLREPVLGLSRGTMRTHNAASLPTGLPNLFDIDVPSDASALRLNLRATAPDGAALELYLYDCTSGECFLWDFTLPAVRARTMIVRSPAAGRWVAAVNSAPSPTRSVRFSLEEIVATGSTQRVPLQPGLTAQSVTRTERLNVDALSPASAMHNEILLCELFDEAAARDAVSYPWEIHEGVVSLATRPVAIGAAVLHPE